MLRPLCAALIAALAACGGAPPAQTAEDPDKAVMDALVALEQRARAARAAGDDDTLLSLYQQMLAVEMPAKLRDFRGRLNYSVACLHGKAGRAEAALAAVEAASKTGWTAADHAAHDPDLALIRTDPRFAAALAEMRHNQIRLKVYEIRRWENPDLPPLQLRFDAMDSAQAETLRAEFGLEALVANAPDQAAAHKAVLAWVHNRWRHSGLNEPVSPNALDILRAVAQGARFRCVEYSVVLAQALNALGYTARVVSLRSEGMSYGTGKGHVISEVWRDDLRQWVALDGQNNAIWRHEGRPLSSHQIQALLAEGRESEIALDHGGSTWMTEPPDPETWLAYFHGIQLALDNRVFDAEPNAPKGHRLLLAPNTHPELLFQGAPLSEVDITADADPLYPPLNQVHVQIAPKGDALICTLRHNMPSFDHFEINGAVSRGAKYVWPLSVGDQALEIQAVNVRGVKGPPTHITVRYHGQPAGK